MAKSTREEQAEEIKKLAEECGVQSNFLFITTFDRYQVQLRILDRLEAALDKETELKVTKQYSKEQKNEYANPLFREYSRAVDSANKTVGTLMRIIKNFNVGGEEEDNDPLMAAINGEDDDDEANE